MDINRQNGGVEKRGGLRRPLGVLLGYLPSIDAKGTVGVLTHSQTLAKLWWVLCLTFHLQSNPPTFGPNLFLDKNTNIMRYPTYHRAFPNTTDPNKTRKGHQHLVLIHSACSSYSTYSSIISWKKQTNTFIQRKQLVFCLSLPPIFFLNKQKIIKKRRFWVGSPGLSRLLPLRLGEVVHHLGGRLHLPSSTAGQKRTGEDLCFLETKQQAKKQKNN